MKLKTLQFKDCIGHNQVRYRGMLLSPTGDDKDDNKSPERKPSTVNRHINVDLAYDLSFSFDDA